MAGTATFSLAEPIANSSQLSLPSVTRTGLGQLAHHGGVEGRAVTGQHLASRRWSAKSAVTKMSLCAIGTPAQGAADAGGDAVRRRLGPGPASASSSIVDEGAERSRCARIMRPRKSCGGLDGRDLALAPGPAASAATPIWCDFAAAHYSITFGHEEQAAFDRRGAASGWLRGCRARSPRRRARRSVMSSIAATGWASGSTPVVSTGAHAFDQVEKAVDLAEHALAFVGGQLQPRQRGDAGDICEAERDMKIGTVRNGAKVHSHAANGLANTRNQRGFGYYPAFAATPANAPAFARKNDQFTPSNDQK